MSFIGILAVPRLTLRVQKLAVTVLQSQQCRTISLYHAIRATTTLGAHDIKNWLPYNFPLPNQVTIDISSLSDTSVGNRNAAGHKRLRLDQVLKEVQPGSFIGVAATGVGKQKATKKSESSAGEIQKLYEISNTNGTKDDGLIAKTAIRMGKGGPFKRVFFTPDSANSEYFTSRMQWMLKFMEHNLPVEISLTAKTLPALEQMVNENPHLHPQAILASMPKMSAIIVQPRIKGQKITWVMRGPRKAGSETMTMRNNTDEDAIISRRPLYPPVDCDARLNRFRENVMTDLEHSADQGLRPDVVDGKVAKVRAEKSRRIRIAKENETIQSRGIVQKRALPWDNSYRDAPSYPGRKRKLFESVDKDKTFRGKDSGRESIPLEDKTYRDLPPYPERNSTLLESGEKDLPSHGSSKTKTYKDFREEIRERKLKAQNAIPGHYSLKPNSSLPSVSIGSREYKFTPRGDEYLKAGQLRLKPQESFHPDR